MNYDDYESPEMAKIHSENLLAIKKLRLDRKRFMYVLFYIPIFLPLLFNFYCLGGGEYHFYFHSILEKIPVLQDVARVSGPVAACVIHSGYLFSLAYLVVVCVFMYRYNIRIFEWYGNYGSEGEWKYYLIASLFFTALFIFQNFVDISSGFSQKNLGVRLISFKFWPMFYLYFVMWIYIVAFCISNFIIKYNGRNNNI